MFGSGVPKTIRLAAEAKSKEDPAAQIECHRQMVWFPVDEYDRGNISKQELRSTVEDLLKMRVDSVQSESDGSCWLMIIPSNHPRFEAWLQSHQEEELDYLIGFDHAYVVVPMSWYFDDTEFDGLDVDLGPVAGSNEQLCGDGGESGQDHALVSGSHGGAEEAVVLDEQRDANDDELVEQIIAELEACRKELLESQQQWAADRARMAPHR